MSGTIRKIATLTGILLMAASIVWAGPAHVNSLRLSHEGNFTVLTVEGDGVIRTAHQSVEAKEGKPFRIVLDCLASRHNLPQKTFSELPACVITDIRTSQYAVTPEEVVRIVLDLREESVYRVEQDGNQVKVMVSDTKTPVFAAWTSNAQMPQKSSPTPAVVQHKKAEPVQTAAQPVPSMKPSIELAKSEERPKSVVKEAPAKPKAEKPAPQPQPQQVVQKQDDKVERDTPIDSKPVPLQVKLGLTGKSQPKQSQQRAEQKSQPAKKSEPVMAQKKSEPEQKPVQVKSEAQEPTVAKVVPSVQKKPSILAHRKTNEEKPVKVNPNITNDTIKRAIAFASYDQGEDYPPRPGDEPKPSTAKKMGKPQEQPKEESKSSTDIEEPKSKLRSAPSSPARKPVLAKSSESQKSSEPAPMKIASLPAPKVNASKTSAAQKTKDVPQPGPAASKNPSRFRRDAAKSARLKQAQVVQFPQRIVIKYKGANGRDPFKTLIEVDKKTGGRVDLNKIPNIETLHLVGVIESKMKGGKDAALMEDLDGIGYILKTGDRVRNGYVAQIDEHAVYFQINEYGWSRTVVKEMEKE